MLIDRYTLVLGSLGRSVDPSGRIDYGLGTSRNSALSFTAILHAVEMKETKWTGKTLLFYLLEKWGGRGAPAGERFES